MPDYCFLSEKGVECSKLGDIYNVVKTFVVTV